MTSPTIRFWANVDKTDTCWNWTGTIINNGYGKATYGGKQTVAHRVSYELTGATIPDGMFLDHTCHNRACVRPDHLRVVTRKENCENLTGAYGNSKSGVRGVYRQGNRWRAGVRHNGKQIQAGSFLTIEEAEAAVIALRLRLFTHNDSDRAA